MMPTTRLVPVRSYVEPALYGRMEQVRASLRRTSRSRFVEDAILEKVERMEVRPTRDRARRRGSTA
jgi:hypothetical protein